MKKRAREEINFCLRERERVCVSMCVCERKRQKERISEKESKE